MAAVEEDEAREREAELAEAEEAYAQYDQHGAYELEHAAMCAPSSPRVLPPLVLAVSPLHARLTPHIIMYQVRCPWQPDDRGGGRGCARATRR